MPIICWGNLAKSADDVQRIEQAIGEYVVEHDENVNAHQFYGSSLYMHRINTLLDHPPASVSLKHLLSNSYLIFTCFEEIGHWQLTGNVSTNVFGAGLWTDAVENDVSAAFMWDVGSVNIMDFSKNPFFQTTVFFDQITNQIAYFGCGRFMISPSKDSFGFKVVDGTLYAWWTRNLVENTTEISGITLTDHNVYRAYIDSELGELYFYVNGVLKLTVDADLPVISSLYMFFYQLKTTADERKNMYFLDLLLEVDR